ncbi:alpha/beta hydrolase [Streptomyces sp. NPDC098781]|uniref:alpha/beta hydrolase n=1 Tax=Streptomyces sp. NPDC098781 TaxID=3366097 RepID=UPI003802E135
MAGHESVPGDTAEQGQSTALLTRRTSRSVRAAVLFLHGGAADSRARSRSWYPAPLRMRPFVRTVAAAVPDADILLAEVRYRVRGWNGQDADPVRDTERALRELATRVGEVPVVLVGHSMGGRAALRAAAAPQVRAVVALGPWCPEGEPVDQLRGKDVVVLHGDHDRVTDPDASVAFVDRARAAGARARVELVQGGDHAMLRHRRQWHRLVASTVAGVLAEVPRPGR